MTSLTPLPITIFSGGQTGVDRAALDFALHHGMPCGGWCPAGRRAEDGPLPPRYPLRETTKPHYEQRTQLNILETDGTLILHRGSPSGGTALTWRLARQYDRPHLLVNLTRNPEEVDPLKQWLDEHTITVLNVAGPRESENPGIYQQAWAFLQRGLLVPTPYGEPPRRPPWLLQEE
jgi:hypothetical protein